MYNSEIIFQLLGITKEIPLTARDMARNLTVTFYPAHRDTGRLNGFAEKLEEAFRKFDTTVIPFQDALNEDGKVRPGIVIVEQGEGPDEDLAINKVSSLYENPILGLFDAPPPIPENPSLQETLDSIVGVLAWNLTHVPIFVEDHRWTMCTMNGAVVSCNSVDDPADDILHSLIPKLAAQVVPPKKDEIVYRQQQPNSTNSGYESHIRDFMNAARIWRDNGLMLAHTSVDDLSYRNRFYKRIVSQYLDNRTGMSYGFLVKQLPLALNPAIPLNRVAGDLKNHDWSEQPVLASSNGVHHACINQFGEDWIVEIPDVWLLSTRSGCNKTDLKAEKDILRLGLHQGKITIETPPASTPEECKPSYDTYAILAHAVGNIITAQLLMARDRKALFPERLSEYGLSISHWHGYPAKNYPISGYVTHGEGNPPVSCSTPQSAAYAFLGKRKSLELYIDPLNGYRGDIHIEPHHGTNITGCMSLTETAAWVDAMYHRQLETGKLSH
jgi:hypothetical protein